MIHMKKAGQRRPDVETEPYLTRGFLHFQDRERLITESLREC